MIVCHSVRVDSTIGLGSLTAVCAGSAVVAACAGNGADVACASSCVVVASVSRVPDIKSDLIGTSVKGATAYFDQARKAPQSGCSKIFPAGRLPPLSPAQRAAWRE